MQFILALLVLFAAPAAAQDGEALRLGPDLYRAGSTVLHAEAGAADVFLAGNVVRTEALVSGTAHLAGRRVTVAAPVEGSVYAAGMDVAVAAPVAGSATLAAYDVLVDSEIAGSLRAMGGSVNVSAPVGGSAVLGGGEVVLDAEIAGDIAIAAEELIFGEDARIGGRLVLYGEAEDAAAVPQSVVPADRVEVRLVEEWHGEHSGIRGPSLTQAAAGYIGGIAALTLCALLAAIVAPYGIEALRDEVALRPFRTMGLGFLALSALIGAAVVVALTIVGILLVPAVLIAAVLAGFTGYVVAVYMIGAGLTEWWRRREPVTFGQRVLAALMGAVVASLVLLVPFLGWLSMLATVLVGTGALVRAAFGPRIVT